MDDVVFVSRQCSVDMDHPIRNISHIIIATIYDSTIHHDTLPAIIGVSIYTLVYDHNVNSNKLRTNHITLVTLPGRNGWNDHHNDKSSSCFKPSHIAFPGRPTNVEE